MILDNSICRSIRTTEIRPNKNHFGGFVVVVVVVVAVVGGGGGLGVVIRCQPIASNGVNLYCFYCFQQYEVNATLHKGRNLP